MNKKVVLGMSGGIDSSIAAFLLLENGYEVIGVTFSFDESTKNNNINKVVSELNIDHYFVDISKEFKNSVISYFVNEYKFGRTPSPCVFCNENIKFPFLNKMADKYNAALFATGHYVQKQSINNRIYIEKGVDKIKDQSYYLWKLNQEILNRVIFPLGNKTKLDIKKLAFNLGFVDLIIQKESMGICFLKNQSYQNFLRAEYPEIFTKIPRGKIYSTEGKCIGDHEGYPFYTIGQKNNLNLIKPGSFYVCHIDAFENALYVTHKEKLYQKKFAVTDYYFQDIEDIKSEGIYVKVRGIGLNPDGMCKIKIISHKKALVYLDDSAWAMAPGQPVVFYIDNHVIGGGICE